MGVIGKQFGAPSGMLGRAAARFMASDNARFNRRVVEMVARTVGSPTAIAELGSGPGVGLAALLDAFPQARVIGADPSAAVTRQAQRRNREALRSGRLQLLHGGPGALGPFAPLDLVLAVHVLYFWHDPVSVLRWIARLLAPGGHIALAYQLEQHLPLVARREFPKEGHILYESDDLVQALLARTPLRPTTVAVIGPDDRPLGRVLLARHDPEER